MKSLVLVLGAGASTEVNLATGHELKGKIASLLDIKFDHFGDRLLSGDGLIADALLRMSSERGLRDTVPLLDTC